MTLTVCINPTLYFIAKTNLSNNATALSQTLIHSDSAIASAAAEGSFMLLCGSMKAPISGSQNLQTGFYQQHSGVYFLFPS